MDRNPLVGTWRLQSFQVQDEQGVVTQPFGEDPVGQITYTADGHMSVVFGRADRPSLHVDDWLAATPEEIVSAARDCYAYCGTYEYRNGEVFHHIEMSLMPNWIGGTQRRFVHLEGDALTLSTPQMRFAGVQRVATLNWRRARANA